MKISLQTKALKFLIVLVLVSCQSTKLPTTSNVNIVHPTNALSRFTVYLDSVGFISDTSRAKITATELSLSEINYFHNKPFYTLNPKNHEIQQSKKFLRILKKNDTLNVDFDIFLKPKSIFAYYYRQKKQSNFIEDGIIEEWHFSSKSEAQYASSEIEKINDLVYFNTFSFILVNENQLYIFHTRASAFGTTLERLFEAFKENLK